MDNEVNKTLMYQKTHHSKTKKENIMLSAKQYLYSISMVQTNLLLAMVSSDMDDTARLFVVRAKLD